jgi:hypothetical protein
MAKKPVKKPVKKTIKKQEVKQESQEQEPQEKPEKKSIFNYRDFIIGIILLAVSSFFLFSETGRNLFVPFKDCTSCLDLYYYLISYGLAIAGIFLLVRSAGIIKY